MARPVEVVSPLDPEVLRFHRMTATEELGRPFEINLDLLSSSESINFDDLLGQPVSVNLALPGGTRRHFHGLVARFAQTGWLGNFAAYRATLRPWFWFLIRTADCRIFQGKTVPDIVKEVFRDRGFTDFDEALTGTYEPREYCVQYRESDFQFVSRLLEQEGIYYFFRHEAGKHTLVLADSYSAHAKVPGYEKIPYYPPAENVVREEDHVSEWSVFQEVQTGVCALTDFDFEKPRAGLLVKSPAKRNHAHADFEVFDYPGDYCATGLGDTRARTRIEELQTQFERGAGRGNPRGLAVGALFELTNHPRVDQNREYLAVSAVHRVEAQAYESGAGGAGLGYECEFTAAFGQQPFRPERLTPRPVVQGPQTAIVVGKAGEEIWTDKHGRVKVQFHWDREGTNDENSSCWVRVSQPWAGKGWGAVAIPRIGQEVVVDFLEGDPDRPLITGRVYNAEETPPYALPAGAMLAGYKSNSTKGGGGYNEYVLDDTKGSELIREHGQFDKDSTIEHDLREHVLNCRSRDVSVDETISVGNNQTYTIGKDQSGTIGVNKTIKVGSNHTETVGANQSVTIGSNKTETVAINKAETIGAAKELTIGAVYQVSVGAAMNETVGAAKAEEIGGLKSVNVGASSSENVAANKSVDAGGNISESAAKNVSVTSGKKMSLKAGDDYAVQGGKNGVIDIADQFTLKCGDASITLKKDGTITIKGKNVTVNGSGEINVKASKNITMKGQKILQN